VSQKKPKTFLVTPQSEAQEHLVLLDSEQLVQLIRKEIKKEGEKQSRKSFWQNVLVGFFYLLLSIIVSLILLIITLK
jgi:hypothetical protein